MPSQLTKATVRIYSALSALRNESGDVFDGIIPFFEPILRANNGKKLDPHEIADRVKSVYKWNMTADIIEFIVPYLIKRGWVISDIASEVATTYTISVPEKTIDLSSEQEVEQQLRSIANEFKLFASDLSPLLIFEKPIEYFEDILIEWLLYVEAFSEQSINVEIKIVKTQSGTLEKKSIFPNITTLTDEEKFLCARFVQFSINEKRENADTLIRIATIGLLTEVVQNFIRPSNVSKTNLVVYLDAPVALELLGVSGNIHRENMEILFDELKKLGCRFKIYVQSIEELQRSLRAVLSASTPYGPTADAMRRGEVLRDFVQQLAVNPIPKFETLGVEVVYRKPEQTPATFKFFSEENRQELYSRLNYPQSIEGRQHDTDIVALLMRQRQGKSQTDLFRSEAIILTKNGILQEITKRFCIEHSLLPKSSIPPVLHRKVFSAAVWLRTGMNISNLEIPKRLLLSSCEHVLAVRPNISDAMRRIAATISDENKAKQLELLLSDERSITALMDKTLGTPNVITAESFPSLWDSMLQPHIEEERARGSSEIAEISRKHKEKLRAISAEATLHKEAVARKEAELAEARAVLDRLINRLCFDVSQKILYRTKIRMIFSFFIAVVFTYISLLNHSEWLVWLTVPIGTIFTWASLTGLTFVRIKFNYQDAYNYLDKIAAERELRDRLGEYHFDWDGRDVSCTHKSLLSRNDNEPMDALKPVAPLRPRRLELD